ncbi:MAG: transcription antitermination factor NusB [Actinobacteria bacterium]|nr:transcription antitermination factor NusB [Actinomycetota bacterium]
MIKASESIMIPARISASDLADAIGKEVSEVQAVLASRHEPDDPGDLLGADLAVAAAGVLGVEVVIEPRDLALERLYEHETRDESAEYPEGRAGRLVKGVVEHLEDLDVQIEAVSEHWSVARMPLIDRNILRLGLFELQSGPEPSTAVIVSEAVRLAQVYSTEKSGSFVNGVLATLAKSVRDG